MSHPHRHWMSLRIQPATRNGLRAKVHRSLAQAWTDQRAALDISSQPGQSIPPQHQPELLSLRQLGVSGDRELYWDPTQPDER